MQNTTKVRKHIKQKMQSTGKIRNLKRGKEHRKVQESKMSKKTSKKRSEMCQQPKKNAEVKGKKQKGKDAEKF